MERRNKISAHLRIQTLHKFFIFFSRLTLFLSSVASKRNLETSVSAGGLGMWAQRK